MADNESTSKVAEMIKDAGRNAMFTTRAPDGTLVSRPMALQEVEFDGDLWFFAAADSRKIAHLATDPRVNVAIASSDTWVSVAGTGRVVQDDAKKSELWNSIVEAWFPKGETDPGVVLVQVEAESAEYWDSPGGKIATVLSFAKAKVTGNPYTGGENERVDL